MKLEIEIGDDGKVGTLPEPLQKFFDERFKEAYGKGATKAGEEAKAQIEAAEKKAREEERERLKASHQDPAAAEKAKNLEIELSKMKEDEALRAKNFEEAQKLRDQRHANELAERDKAVEAAQKETDRRTIRIRELAKSEIRVEAIKAGARAESLDELEALLGSQIGLDQDLKPFVRDAKDPEKPRLDKDGKPVLIEGLVTLYLTERPHHKAPVKGTGGRATGGASFTGQPKTKNAEADAALEQVTNDPSIANAASFIETAVLGASR